MPKIICLFAIDCLPLSEIIRTGLQQNMLYQIWYVPVYKFSDFVSLFTTLVLNISTYSTVKH